MPLDFIDKEMMYMLGAALPAVVLTGFALEGVLKGGNTLQKKFEYQKSRKKQLEALPQVVKETVAGKEKKRTPLKTMENYADRQISRIGWKLSPGVFMAGSTGLAAVTMFFIYNLAQNIFMAITSALIMVFVPFLVLSWAVQKHDQKIMDQLPVAIQLFTVEFSIVKNLQEALSRAAQGVDAPLNKYLEKCSRDLAASRPPRKIFNNLASDLNSKYGRLWAQMLLASVEDRTVVKLMPRLISRLSGQRLLQQKNMKEISGERRIGMLLNFLILPGFVVSALFVPMSQEYFNTALGKLSIALTLLSVLVGILLDQLMSKVDF